MKTACVERSLIQRGKSYFLLTKPGIIAGNTLTAAGAYFLAARREINALHFVLLLWGLALIVASACVCNNYIDRFADAKMHRTRRRPLVAGEIAPENALRFGIGLGVLGGGILFYFSNGLAFCAALSGFAIYVFGYSHFKYYSVHSTLLGSFAGATPPLVGYCGIYPHFDGGALFLFLTVALWQMPHFFAIAIYRLKEYQEAGLPIFPLRRGVRATKRRMLYYTAAFMGISPLLFVFARAGFTYLIASVLFGLLWLGLCVQGFFTKNDRLWARRMFLFSLLIILGLSFTMAL